ncbi:MAG TPA: redoxin domain-containing protein [Fimbriimonadaceae bacterium]|nr:redoxin domain-containing protein [Fimbriimonadaceae bacterium]
MRKLLLALCLATALSATSAIQEKPYLEPGKDAPTFSLKGSDGKSYDLAKMREDKSAFVLFWKQRCPHNARAAQIYNKLVQTYKGVPFVGVVNTDEAGAKAWAEQFSTAYPMLPDADKALIKGYKLQASIAAFEIGKDGKVVAVFGGYGSEAIDKLNKAMAAAAKVPAASLDTGAPARETWG